MRHKEKNNNNKKKKNSCRQIFYKLKRAQAGVWNIHLMTDSQVKKGLSCGMILRVDPARLWSNTVDTLS